MKSIETKVLSSHYTGSFFENATITVYSGFVFEENSVRKITLKKSVHKKTRADVFRFLRLKNVFEKLPFRVSVNAEHNRRNKAVFSNFSDELWMLPNLNPMLLSTLK